MNITHFLDYHDDKHIFDRLFFVVFSLSYLNSIYSIQNLMLFFYCYLAGKLIKHGKIQKIVGLDPASPSFKYNDIADRLADTDAHYVEVIISC